MSSSGSSFDEFVEKLGETADKLGDVAKETWTQLRGAAEKAWDTASDMINERKGDRDRGGDGGTPPNPPSDTSG